MFSRQTKENLGNFTYHINEAFSALFKKQRKTSNIIGWHDVYKPTPMKAKWCIKLMEMEGV